MDDQIGLMLMILDGKLQGAFNLTAPNPVTVNEFAKHLGKALKRPAWMRMPAGVLRAGMGEGAAALLDLQRVVPERAIECGYEFRFPTIADALEDLV
jgi:NAD dependent epimerase/dehydratase family enzyme